MSQCIASFNIDGEERYLLPPSCSFEKSVFTADKGAAYVFKSEEDCAAAVKDMRIFYGYIGMVTLWGHEPA